MIFLLLLVATIWFVDEMDTFYTDLELYFMDEGGYSEQEAAMATQQYRELMSRP